MPIKLGSPLPPCIDEKTGPSSDRLDDLPIALKEGDHEEHFQPHDPPESVYYGTTCSVDPSREPPYTVE